jgi:hypothetical protein
MFSGLDVDDRQKTVDSLAWVGNLLCPKVLVKKSGSFEYTFDIRFSHDFTFSKMAIGTVGKTYFSICPYNVR